MAAGRARTLPVDSVALVERFHSVRRFPSYDVPSANTSSSDSGLFADEDDDADVYSNWSPGSRITAVPGLTVSSEDLSSTSDHWVG